MKIMAFSGKAKNGKTTSANIMKSILDEVGYTSAVVSYGSYLKQVCQLYYSWDGNKDEKGRTLLQTVGTEIGRKENDNIWVNKLIDDVNVFCNHLDFLIIDDCRFENEISTLIDNDYDVITIRINRKDFDNGLTDEQKNHKSETSLDDYKFDYSISISSGIDNVNICMKELFNIIKRERIGD